MITSASGEFQFHGRGEDVLEASHPEYAPGRVRPNAKRRTESHLVLRLRMKSDVRSLAPISGTVLGPDGAPVEGARVKGRLHWHPDTYRELFRTPESETHTDETGQFTLKPLSDISYDFTITHESYGAGFANDVAPGTKGLVVRLGAPGIIRGRVVDGSGGPVPRFGIALIPSGELRKRYNRWYQGEVFHNPSGRYSIGGLAHGAYKVHAMRPGFASSPATGVTVPGPGGAPVDVDFVLAPALRLSGVVEESLGHPVAGATVAIGGHGPPSLGEGGGSAQTSSDGRFVLEGLRPGKIRLMVFAANFRANQSSTVDLREESSPEVTITLVRIAPEPAAEDRSAAIADVGIHTHESSQSMEIVAVMEGSPAAQAGLAPGDVIVKIDGKPFLHSGLPRELLRGEDGTEVRLDVKSPGKAEPVTITLRRRNLQ
jgi:protocatechuate 3,4-dioxygenase beta subunit